MPETNFLTHKKIGLALGSGSARGCAHIGVVRALIEAGIHIDCIAGTSIGAVVGAVYSSGGIDSLEDAVRRLDWMQIVHYFDVVLPKSGLIDGKRVSVFIRQHIKEKNIEDLPCPFSAVSTDLTSGKEVVICEGDIIEAIRASISVPGILTPVKIDDMTLVDGGLVNPVPVSVARNMGADFVIAVDLNHDIVGKKGTRDIKNISSSKAPHPVSEKAIENNHTVRDRILKAINKKIPSIDFPSFTQVKQWMAREPMPGIFEVMVSSINILETQLTTMRLEAEPPDLLIQPQLGHIKFLEFNRAEEAIAEGYAEAKKRLAEIGVKGG